MDEPGDVVMKLDGMKGEGCEEAVRRAIRALDPQAQVRIERERGQVSATTRADTLEVTAALAKTGYNATAMTG